MGRWFLLASALAIASPDGYGLSLEQAQGSVTLGRPLDIVVPIRGSGAGADADVCEQAVVYLGESLVPPHLVQLSRLPDERDATRQRLRVQTRIPVSEPYVSVELSAGCVGRQTRIFTLLADMAAVAPAFNVDAASAARPSASPLPPSVSGAASAEGVGGTVPATRPAFRQGRLSSGEPSPHASASGARAESLATAAPASRSAASGRRATTTQALPVLKLDPIELLEDAASSAPRLVLSMEWTAPPDLPDPALDARRADARRAWAELLEPDQTGATAAQVETLQAQLASARVALEAAVQLQTDQARQLEDELQARYNNPVFLGVLAALLAALAALGFLWRSRSRDASTPKEWWKSVRAVDEPFRQLVERRRTAKARKAELADRAGAASTLDVDMDSLFADDAFKTSASNPAGDTRPPNTHPATSAFLPSVLPGTSASLLAEELFDLQQQVEFFISLGQLEQAVEVLLNHLSDGHEPSPLAYLDLLKLYHQMGLRDKYQSLMTEFNAQFNAAAPSFDNYAQSRRGLERYSQALSRIQSLWPSPAVLELIEASLFRHPNSAREDMFDLEAYRELLLLYGVAREILADASNQQEARANPDAEWLARQIDAPVAAATGFGATSLQPLSAGEPGTPAQSQVGEQVGQRGDQALYADLDLDLSDAFAVIQPVEVPSATAQTPETPQTQALAKDVPDAEVPTADTQSRMLDFDFTDLEAEPTRSIKKSGPPV